MRVRFKLLALIALLASGSHAEQIATTTNHHDQSTFGLYSAPSSQQAASRQAHQSSARTPRVGLAPQERPACQLRPLAANKRRHLAEGARMTDSLAGSLAINASGTASQQQQTELLVAPNVSSLNQNKTRHLFQQLQQSDGPTVSANSKGSRVDTGERLRQLRQLLVSNNYDAYLVTPNDEHGSEYVADYDRRLRFISGFTGSNGYALVLLDRAVLFTDGRYALQADADLDCNWWLVVGDEPLADLHLWLRHQGARGLKVATDARLLSLQSFDYLEEQLKRLDQSEFALISQDLVDVVWDNHMNEAAASSAAAAAQQQQTLLRERPNGRLTVQPLEFSGQMSWQEKVARLGQAMDKLRARHYVISKLDDIAWLLNLRGSDIPLAPLFKAYLLVSRQPVASGNSGASLAGHQSTGATSTTVADLMRPSAPISSLEQLAGSQSQPLSVPTLQAPQVLQVQVSQTIRLTLYVDLRKVSGPTVREHLHLDNWTSVQTAEGQLRIQVELRDYDAFIMEFRDKFGGAGLSSNSAAAVATIASTSAQQGRLLLDAMANVAIHVLAKNYDDRLILMEPLLQRLKAVKSELEVEGMRQAHWRDSLAIAMLLGQLEQDIGLGGRTNRWSETAAARELQFYRSLMDFNRGQSFDTISAYGSNGAIVHYRPPSSETELEPGERLRLIGNQSTYLLDSGGQYLDGTTDITRTLHYGTPSEFEREAYTRVLMGAIDMMSLVFAQPARAPATKINDLLARRHLHELGLDYAHGTGHGIGAFSLVHEAPALIEHYASQRAQLTAGLKQLRPDASQSMVVSEQQPIQANMFTSVEPGYYRAGEFGIRLENIVVTRRVEQPDIGQAAPDSNTTWLRFEPISLVPFEPKLIKLELLSNKQKAWLNSYNLMVRLRMTQQINNYLARIREDTNNKQSRNTTTSSEPLDPLGRDNYLKLEANKLRALLQQAHKWIMAKTELIALDVPPHLGANSGCSSSPNGLAARTRLSQQQQSQSPPPAINDEWSALGSDPEGQRLMLAYMSGLPFNDMDATRAVASLTTGRQNNSSIAHKCVGIECDLLLLEALNAHQLLASKETRQPQPTEASAQVQKSAGFLDLFQLAGTGAASDASWLSLTSVWPLLGLALLLTLQLAVMAYVCVGGDRKSVRRSRTSQQSAELESNGQRRQSDLQPPVPLVLTSQES